MAVSLAGKGIIGFASIGTVSLASIYFGSDLFRKEQSKNKRIISSLIREKNPSKRLISFPVPVEDQTGKDAWSRYRNSNKKFNSGGVDGWSATESDVGSTVVAPSDFIFKCSVKSGTEVLGTDDPLYKEVLSYCTRDTLVGDLILENVSGEGKKLLKSDDVSGGSVAGSRYQNDNKVKQQGGDKGKLQDGGTNHPSNTVSTHLKSVCEAKASSKADSIENEDYKDVVAGCTR